MGEIIIYRAARKHFILDSEIREVLNYPLIRYVSVSRKLPDTEVIVSIGGPVDGPWIEVVAEERDGALHVFHAMMMTRRTALEAESVTGRSVTLSWNVVAQRPGFPRQERQNMTRHTETRRSEAEYEAMADAFERGEFTPTGDAWLAPDAEERLHPNCSSVTVPLSDEEQRELDSIAASSKMDRVDVIRAAVREYLAAHGA